jgi:sterol desaturase/sphingolipid hydroxylase (fatty acid hydroxylase superfamily)
MSQTSENYWGEFAIDIPVGLLLVGAGWLHTGAHHPAAALLTFLAGLLFFSFFEYCFHRWIFHGSIPAMVEGHRAHHENPTGYSSLPFFLPALLMLGLLGILVVLIPVSYAFLLTGAVAFGYVTYGLSHFIIHHHHFRRRLARRWAANHHIHHYHPDSNFGVTTPLWDRLFHTRYQRH